jgi:hypothetical protein
VSRTALGDGGRASWATSVGGRTARCGPTPVQADQYRTHESRPLTRARGSHNAEPLSPRAASAPDYCYHQTSLQIRPPTDSREWCHGGRSKATRDRRNRESADSNVRSQVSHHDGGRSLPRKPRSEFSALSCPVTPSRRGARARSERVRMPRAQRDRRYWGRSPRSIRVMAPLRRIALLLSPRPWRPAE